MIYFNLTMRAAIKIDKAKKILFEVKLAEKLQLSVVQHATPVPNINGTSTQAPLQPLVQIPAPQFFLKIKFNLIEKIKRKKNYLKSLRRKLQCMQRLNL